jgi:16S rRNA pseudouridine516 synthase
MTVAARGIRLDRYLSQAAAITRSQARSAIQRGQVRVDGVQVRLIGHPVGAGQVVSLDGVPLQWPETLYLMLHKPVGLVSATSDPAQPTVMSLLPPTLAARVHLVGRLDKETSGLLLLSEDGAWSHRITSPNHPCAKVYLADLAEPLPADAAGRLAEGLLLRGESRPTRPAALETLEPLRVRITLYEGRYHQVRRMVAALGSRVTGLHRERIGGLTLDPGLAPGQWRPLQPDERQAVLAVSGVELESPGS